MSDTVYGMRMSSIVRLIVDGFSERDREAVLETAYNLSEGKEITIKDLEDALDMLDNSKPTKMVRTRTTTLDKLPRGEYAIIRDKDGWVDGMIVRRTDENRLYVFDTREYPGLAGRPYIREVFWEHEANPPLKCEIFERCGLP
jgi:DNA-binding transcriptional ArsR family regulator